MSGAALETPRRVLAGFAGLVGIVLGLCSDGIWAGGKGLLLLLLLVASTAAVCIHYPGLGSQLVARAVWRSNLWVGTFTFITSDLGHGEAGMAWGMVGGSAAALFVVDPSALVPAGERDGYAPSLGGAALLRLTVRALSDAQTLFVVGIVAATQQPDSSPGDLLLVGSLALTASVVGAYRLAFWGVVLNVATCSFLFFWALLSSSNPFYMGDRWPLLVVLLSFLELLAGVPIVVSRLIDIPLPPVIPARWRGAVAYVNIGLILVYCALAWVGVFAGASRVGGHPPYGAFTSGWR